ncbi:MAG TPA: patatin-like phospholipase family protein [Longimicrobiales bacterium]
MLTGGGARGAYQVGVMQWLARNYPELQVPILTGVSAGAINAAHIASHPGTFKQACFELRHLWAELTPDHIFRVGAPNILWHAARYGMRLMSGGILPAPQVRAFLDTKPLWNTLEESYAVVDGELTGIKANIARGKLKAVAITATSYTTTQSVTWVQGKDIHLWTRPQRRSEHTNIRLEHIMASAALPIFFPAIKVGNAYYGDGGVRLAAPLSPALHLGAERIIAVSTRYAQTQAEGDAALVRDYPPPAQVLGVLMNAIFLDLVDQDAVRLERINNLLESLPPEEREGMRPVQLLVVRPSRDLGRLVTEYEPKLPTAFKFMTRGLGTRETRSPDVLSMLMFQRDYLTRLMEIGEADAEMRAEEIDRFLKGT